MRFTSGNEITLLRNGSAYFPALLLAIQNASHEIFLQTYIYEADETGTRIGNALKQAAERKVSVNVLLDGFGCKDLPKSFVEELEQAGVRVMFYRPKISPWSLKKNRLRRLHRKVAVIDSHIAFVGGINIIDDSNALRQIPARIDYAVRIEGTLLPEIEKNVRNLWRRVALTHLWRADGKPLKHHARHQHRIKDGIKAAFVIRDNVLHRRDIENAYLEAIEDAKTEIIIANAYFVPGRKFRKAMIEATQRGVKVTLLLQGRKEYFLMFATHAFYNEFLRNNIEIYEYRKSFMHSKVAVIDHTWSTVGSSNIDPFSLLMAHEANIIIHSKLFAAELKTDLEFLIQDGGVKITAQEWVKASLLKRVASWIAYGMVRLFLGITGYSKE